MSVWFRTAAVLLAISAGQAFAQTTHDVYLDLDSNPATGCDVASVAGTVAGAEVRLRAGIDGDPAQVQSVTRATCAGGVFGAPQSQPAGYPVGANLGIGGADVIEFSTALAGLGEGGPARLIFVSANDAGADLVEAAITLPGVVTPPAPDQPAVIPTTGWLALLLLAGFTVWLVRRHPAFGSTFALLLMMGVGVAWAANFISDGQTNDWTGETPVATDASNDASDGSAEIDIGAVFAETENARLFVRVDVRDLAPTANQAPTLAAITFDVDENAAAATPVGSITGTDPDAGQTLSYAITAGNTGNTFAIDAGSGAITVANATALDFETTTSFALTVTVTDDGEPALSDSATVTITLDDVNEAPQIDAQTFAVSENAANGSNVGAVVATDPDGSAPNATLTYAITGGNTGNAFAINPASGVITVATSAAVTVANTPFELTVTVNDGGTPVLDASAIVTVNVTDQSDAPEFSSPAYAFAIDENGAVGGAVGSVVATDPDAGQMLSYSIASGNTDGAFALDPASGAITIANAAAIDFETNPSFILTVNVTDDGTTPLTDSASVTVTLNDLNEAPSATDATFAVAENSPAGTAVNTVTAIDPDTSAPNATLSFALAAAGNTDGAFVIDPASGVISVANASAITLANAPFALTVTVTDGGAPPLDDSASITIDVTDQNDAPQFGQPAYAFQLDEHSPAGSTVGTVAATDPDAAQTLTYAITGGDPGNAFAIDGISGVVSVADPDALDFETAPVFNLTVSATDDGAPALSDTATIAVTLDDVNEAPVATDAALSVPENSANGTVVGTVAAVDEDSSAPNNTLAFAITDGDAGGVFAIDPASGEITVANGLLLDFETAVPFVLEVTVTDGGALADTATVTMTVLDANEAPQLAATPRAVAENSPAGTPAGVPLSGTDPDTTAPNNTLSYAITGGNPGNAFAIDPATGQLSVLTPAQITLANSPITVQVTVADGGAPSLFDTELIDVTITDVNDPPGFISAPYAFAIAENTPGASSIGSVIANDVDVGQTLSFAIDSGNTDGAFALDPSSGEITVASAAALDFELNPTFVLGVSVTDDHAIPASATTTVTITLNDLNEAPTDLALSNSSVAEDASVGTQVGVLSSVDPDAGNTHTYSLVAGAGDTDNASFQIVGNALQTAVLLDFEVQSSYTVRVQTEDQGGLVHEEAFAIVSTDANEPASLIALSVSSIAENEPPASVVGLLSSTDPDTGDTHTYTLVAGTGDTGNASFQIAGNALQTAAAFDFETQTNYSVRIRSTDAGGLFVEQAFALVVTDSNEAPTAPALDNATLAEEQPAGTVVGNLSASDVDAGSTLTFALVPGAGSTDNGQFQVVGTQLLTDAVLDFETQSSYAVRIGVTDGTLSTEAAFTITLTGVNEPPTAVALGNNVIDEAEPAGTVVGTLTTTDDDVGDTFTYTLAAGAGSTDNASFQIVGNQLQTNAVLDFDAQPSYSIRVRSTDSGALFFEQTFTVTLNNINEQPSVLALGANAVAENQPAGTGVGALSTTDPDTGDTFTYTLVPGAGDTDNASFTIAGNQLQTAASFNFEADASYDVRIRSTDSGGLFVEQAFNIVVTNVNETPTALALPDNQVDENQPVNTAVGTFSTIDPDTGDTFTYTLVAGAGADDNGSFTIVGNTLQTNAVFDFEADASYSVRVRSTDAGGLFVEQQFTVVIVNVPEPPTVQNQAFDAAGNTRLSVAPVLPTDPISVNATGSVLTGATDPEGGALTASLVSASAGAVVTVDPDGSFTYVPPPGATASDTFTFRVTDTDTLFADGTVTVTLIGKVWYVRNNAAAGGFGRSTDPFDTLTEAETASAANDILFVFAGSGTSGGQNAGITLKNGQKLWGEFNGLTVAPFPQLVPPGARPLIGNAAGNGVSVIAATGNPRTDVEIRGLSISAAGAGANAIDVTSSGDATAVLGVRIGDNIVTGATAEGIDINAGSLAAQNFAIHDNNLTATGNALDLQRTAGTVTITAFDDNQVTGNSTAGGIRVTGPQVDFDATPGGAYETVSGGTTVIGAAGNAIDGAGLVLDQVSGDLAFSLFSIASFNGGGMLITGTGAVDTAAGTGMRVTATAGTGFVLAANGPALQLTNLTAALQVQQISSTNSPTTGVALVNVAGGTTPATISIPTGSVASGALGTAYLEQGGNATVTFSGNISSDTGRVVSITDKTGGTTTFNGSVGDIPNNNGMGILLNNNTGATIRFHGGVQLTTGANAGFTATGGGTIEVCDENPCDAAATGALVNTLGTTSGTALNVANTTISANRLEFRSISSNGGSGTGVILSNTGTAGGLSIKGTGSAGSGGTIANKTGGDGATAQGIGIYLNNTSGVSLSHMQLNDFENFGIRGSGVDNFALTNTTINALDGSPLNGTTQGEGGVGEGSIRFDNVTGTVTITDSTITHGVYDNVGIFNTNTAAVLNFTASNTTFATTTALNTGNDALRIEIDDTVAGAPQATANIVIDNDCDFTSARGDLLDVIAQRSVASAANAAVVDLDLIGNDFSNNHVAIASAGGGVTLHGQGNFNLLVDDNDLRDARGRALNISKAATAGVYTGTVNNNRIGVTGVAFSGSDEASGIFVDGAGAGSMSMRLTNNQVRRTHEAGIFVLSNNQAIVGNNGTLSLTVTGNVVTEPESPLSFAGLWVDIGTGVSGDTSSACVDIGGAGGLGNDFSTGDPFNAGDISLAVQSGSVMRFPGYGGSNNNDAQIASYLTGRNLNPGTTVVSLSHTGTMTTIAGPCP